ncbi:MAG: hypothetical protein MMC23_002054 [Stictis urceolatum]|nr:hypothetical protein [Stictis urceolata]
MPENLNKFQEGIALGDLPRTFQDAIFVARQIGVRFLWIDALCIIQDRSDWEVEAGRMAEVYQNSYLNIAASNGDSSHAGLALSTPPSLSISTCPSTCASQDSCQNHTSYVRPWSAVSTDFNKQTLQTRAWALQESILSPRVLYFCNEQLVWQCHGSLQGEDGYRWSYMDEWQDIPVLTPPQFSFSNETEAYETWSSWIADHSKRQITFKSDKLATLAGLTSWYREKTGMRSLVGLWSARDSAKMVTAGLVWSKLDPEPELGERLEGIPSWSWASIDGPVRPLAFFESWKADAVVLDAKIGWKGVEFTSDLDEAWIDVRATVVHAEMQGSDSPTAELAYKNSLGILAFDAGASQGRQAVYLLIGGSKIGRNSHTWLLAIESDERSIQSEVPCYRRAGIALFEIDMEAFKAESSQQTFRLT